MAILLPSLLHIPISVIFPVTFHHLTLHHVGIYHGRHSFDLSSTPEKPLCVFVGMNGSGKTTFFHALQIVLFGRHSPPFLEAASEGTVNYDSFLASLIHHHVPKDEGAFLELEFSAIRSGQLHTYRLQRSWRCSFRERKSSSRSIQIGQDPASTDSYHHLRESVEVFCDNKRDSDLSSHWDDGAVDEFIPRTLASLFFFDGEKLREWQEHLSDGTLIAAAMQNLLGLDVLDRTIADLTVLEKQKQKNALPSTDLKALAFLQQKQDEATGHLLLAIQQLGSATAESERGRKRLASAEKELHNRGAHLVPMRGALEAKLEVKRLALTTARAERASLKIQADRLRKAWVGFRARVEARDAALVAAAPVKMRRVLEDLLASNPIHTLDPTFEDLQTGLNSQLTVSSKNPADLENDIAALRAQLDRIPEESDLSKYQLEAAEAQAFLEQSLQRARSLETEVDRAQAIENEAKSKVKAMELELTDHLRAHQEVHRSLELVRSALNRFTIFRQDLIYTQAKKLSLRLTENYARLLHKEGSLVDQLKIEVETLPNMQLRWSLTLVHEGHIRDFRRFSMGEQQLLAIALIWSLAQLSGWRAPFVIDTPLARLDSIHRENVATTFLPSAAHQVIVFATDQEVLNDKNAKLISLSQAASSDQMSFQQVTDNSN